MFEAETALVQTVVAVADRSITPAEGAQRIAEAKCFENPFNYYCFYVASQSVANMNGAFAMLYPELIKELEKHPDDFDIKKWKETFFYMSGKTRLFWYCWKAGVTTEEEIMAAYNKYQYKRMADNYAGGIAFFTDLYKQNNSGKDPLPIWFDEDTPEYVIAMDDSEAFAAKYGGMAGFSLSKKPNGIRFFEPVPWENLVELAAWFRAEKVFKWIMTDDRLKAEVKKDDNGFRRCLYYGGSLSIFQDAGISDEAQTDIYFRLVRPCHGPLYNSFYTSNSESDQKEMLSNCMHGWLIHMNWEMIEKIITDELCLWEQWIDASDKYPMWFPTIIHAWAPTLSEEKRKELIDHHMIFWNHVTSNMTKFDDPDVKYLKEVFDMDMPAFQQWLVSRVV